MCIRDRRTRASVGKFERHIERKNESYENMNVDLSRTPMIVHFQGCGELTYNEHLDRLIDVYKRQGLGFAAELVGRARISEALRHHMYCRFRCLRAFERRAVRARKPRTEGPLLGTGSRNAAKYHRRSAHSTGHGAVSYTHLDVYKRQL